jgi:hypothetical protein
MRISSVNWPPGLFVKKVSAAGASAQEWTAGNPRRIAKQKQTERREAERAILAPANGCPIPLRWCHDLTPLRCDQNHLGRDGFQNAGQSDRFESGVRVPNRRY